MEALDLSELDAGALRQVLPGFLAGFLADPSRADRNRARVTELVGGWSDTEALAVRDMLQSVGAEHRFYAADPTCRDLARAWSRDVVLEPTLTGVEHLRAAVEAGPTIVLCNHRSYFDSTAADAVLAWAGHADLADRLFSAAGPKVYEDLFRRVAAACLNTLPVPQSTSFAHTEQLPRRELARRAFQSVEAAGAALRDGYVLLLFPEGSRTRTERMGSFLRGVHRYLGAVPGAHVVPTAIDGTEQVMAVGDRQVHAARVGLTFAPRLTLDSDTSTREALALAHAAITALLPEECRPEPGTPAVV